MREETLYDEEDGLMFYAYYGRPANPTVGNVPPDVVISFGNVPLTPADRTRISTVTGFPMDEITGFVEGGSNEICDEEGLEDFCRSIPPRAMLVLNPTDATAVTGHAMAQLPMNHRFFIDLFLLKISIHRGVAQENAAVVENGLEIPSSLPRL
jgi:hypothetical protein